jgi:hypothetical protein
MKRLQSAATIVCLAALFAADDAARPDPPAPAQPSDDEAPAQKEKDARAKAADEMAAVARFAAELSAYDDARRAFARAAELSPTAGAFKADLDGLKEKKAAPGKGAAAKIADKRTKALAKCAELLAPAAATYAQADRGEDLARLATLMHVQGVPADAALAKLDVVYFEPYLDWRRKKDVEKLNAGWEFVDGAWADPKKVASMNAAHATWEGPWTVSDDVHEVTTTQPLRTARQALARVAAFRRFFLDYFAGEWDLATPNVKLPVVVCGTRAELEERAKSSGGGAVPAHATAFYQNGTGAGHPCFVSFEVHASDESLMKLDFPGLRRPLQHEIAHQIAFEYSKHAATPDRLATEDIWAVEGVAEFLANFDMEGGVWTMTKKRTIPFGKETMDTAFAWSRANAAKLTPIDQLVGLSHAQFTAVENYRVAATLALYLLEGKDRAYRGRFIKLLETVHQARENAGTFASCFDGVDVKTLDSEFRAYAKTIPVDAK